LIALVIGFLLQQLGALLISGLIVIPAAASRMVATSFRQMLLLSGAFGLLAGALGIFSSAQLNLPTGPTIVLANVAFLILAMALGGILGRRKLIRPAAKQLDRV
jgi:zinc transport system permease protein